MLGENNNMNILFTIRYFYPFIGGTEKQALAFVTFHSLSRISPLIIMNTLNYVVTEQSKMTKALSEQSIQLLPLLIIALLIMLLLLPLQLALGLFLGLLLTSWFCKLFFAKKLQGYNGDCLGACEQLTECFSLLILALYY